jgi:hypothetical protein
MSTRLRLVAALILGVTMVAAPAIAFAAEGHGGGGGRGGGGGGASPHASPGGGQFQGGTRGGGGEAIRSAPGGRVESGVRSGGQVGVPLGGARVDGSVRGGGEIHGPAGVVSPHGSWNRDWGEHSGTWQGRSDFGRAGVWGRGRDWDDWRHFGYWGWGYPWWGYSWYGWPGYRWSRLWWPGYYGYYGGYGVPYYGGDLYGSYGSDYGTDITPYAAAQPMTATDSGTDSGGYYAQALTAFQQGDYRGAMRLASHAEIDNPQDAEVRLLLALSMFGSGDYRGAAMEAHGLAAMGKIPDWEKVFGLYGKLQPYEQQLRALEKFSGEHASAAEGRFLLGFLYLMQGQRDVARDEFLAALKLMPQDSVAAQLLTHTGGTVPAEIAQRLSEQHGQVRDGPQANPGAPGSTATSRPPVPPSPVRK